jgi:hypothetical protein
MVKDTEGVHIEQLAHYDFQGGRKLMMMPELGVFRFQGMEDTVFLHDEGRNTQMQEGLQAAEHGPPGRLLDGIEGKVDMSKGEGTPLCKLDVATLHIRNPDFELPVEDHHDPAGRVVDGLVESVTSSRDETRKLGSWCLALR